MRALVLLTCKESENTRMESGGGIFIFANLTSSRYLWSFQTEWSLHIQTNGNISAAKNSLSANSLLPTNVPGRFYVPLLLSQIRARKLFLPLKLAYSRPLLLCRHHVWQVAGQVMPSPGSRMIWSPDWYCWLTQYYWCPSLVMNGKIPFRTALFQ